MNVVLLLKGLLQAASAIAGYLKDKQLIESGKAQVIAESLEAANHALRKIQTARHRFRTDPDYRERVRNSYRADPE